MNGNPLQSLDAYSQFVAQLLDRPDVLRSTLSVWSVSPYTGVAEGEVFFVEGLRLRLHEELDFEDGLITSYGYEIYRGQEKLCWYDDFSLPMIRRWPRPIHTTNTCRRTSNKIVCLRQDSASSNQTCRRLLMKSSRCCGHIDKTIRREENATLLHSRSVDRTIGDCAPSAWR